MQSKIKFLERLPELRPVDKDGEVVLRFPEVQPLNPPVLQLDDVVFGYTKDKIVLNRVTISAGSDSRICVVGKSWEENTIPYFNKY